MLKIYSDSSLYHPEQRYHLNDITKALWNDRTPEERERVYGAWVHRFEAVPDIGAADVALLAMKWNYYVDRDLVPQAFHEIETAARHGKKIAVFSGGDFPANLHHTNVILFEAGGYRSASGLAYHSGLPFFLKDYLKIYCSEQLQYREKTSMPVIGFCGQAGVSASRAIYRELRRQFRVARYRMGGLKWQPPPFETTVFRRRVLRQFEGRSSVKANFVLREQYHAGDGSDKGDFSPQKTAFVQNVLDSDYTVCMRGGGNFSIRFYETLALGRIPVFVDTDCLLPFEDKISYRSIFPWIEAHDLPHAAEIVADFHARLSTAEFKNLQSTCRALWAEHFTPNGFYTDFLTKVDELR